MHRRSSASALLMAWAFFLLMAAPQRATAVGTPYPVKTGDGSSVNLHAARGHLGALGNSVLFSAYDSSTGDELWRSDGSEAGSYMIKDINPGPANSGPQNFASLNGKVLFTADDGVHGRELWITDGTTSGTMLIKDIYPGSTSSYPEKLISYNGILYFFARTATSQTALWKTDGTPEGTLPVKELCPGNDRMYERIIAANGQLLIFIRTQDGLTQELWKSDGTAEGTVLVTSIPGGMLNYMTECNGRVFFDLLEFDSALWVSDGTAIGTFKLKPIQMSGDPSRPEGMACAGSSLFFRAEDLYGVELWKSDGTVAGTVMVKDINTGPEGSNPSYFGEMNGKAFFSAATTLSGMELWLSDGTEPGTRILKDINPGPDTSKYDHNGFYSANGKGFFLADNGVNGQKIFVTDGTADGTFSLGNNLGVGGFLPEYDNYQTAGNNLFFYNGWELWAVSLAPAPHSVISTPAWSPVIKSSPFTIIGEAHSDTGSPIAKVEVSTDNGQTWALADGTTSWQYTFTAPGEGVYTIRSRATDLAGQIETAGPGIQVTIDLSPPTGSIVIRDYDAMGRATLIISANANDAWVSCPPAYPQICGSVDISLSNDGANWSWFAGYDAQWQLVAGSGTRTVYMRLKDTAGNTANYSASIVVSSKPAPTSSILQPTNNSITNLASGAITGIASCDPGTTIQRVEVSTNGGLTWQTATGTNVWTLPWSPVEGGYSAVMSRAVDSLGLREMPTSIFFTIDRTPPMGTISFDGTNYLLNAPDGVYCFMSPCVNRDLCMLLPDSSTWQPVTTVLPLGTTSIYLRDRAGNIGSAFLNVLPTPTSIRIDQTIPNYFSRIQAACNIALSDNVIKLVGTTFTEDLNLTRDIAVTLRGGYDSNHGMMTGTSIINGSLTASAGTATLENLEIRGNVTIGSGMLVPANVSIL